MLHLLSNVIAKTNAISHTVGAHALAVIPDYLS